MKIDPETHLEQQFLQKLEQLESITERLLGGKYESTLTLWQIQEDLLDYLLSIRARRDHLSAQSTHLRRVKQDIARSKPDGWKATLAQFGREQDLIAKRDAAEKRLYCLAKRVGDAFAWLCFQGDKAKLFSLMENAPNPPPPTGHSLRGMLEAARGFASKGIGFPVLHDLTNILRIGDVTFVQGDGRAITTEMKTQVVSNNGKEVEARVNVTATLTVDDISFFEEKFAFVDKAKGNSPETVGRAHSSTQLDRQVERMRRAVILQSTEPNSFYTHEDAATLVVPPVECTSHWGAALDVLQRAQASGYASCVVDSAMVYVALRVPRTLTYPWLDSVDVSQLPLQRVTDDVVRSGILLESPNQNRLWVATTADHLRDDPPLRALPLPLHPYPIEVVRQLLRGELLFYTFLNTGRLIDGLRRAGITASMPHDARDRDRDFIEVTSQTVTQRGATVSFRLGGLRSVAQSIVYECLSVEGFVQLTRAMVQASHDVANERIRPPWSNRPKSSGS